MVRLNAFSALNGFHCWFINQRFTDHCKIKPLITLPWWRQIWDMFAEDMPLLIAYLKRHNETFLFTQSDEAKHFPYIEDNVLQALYQSSEDHMLGLLFTYHNDIFIYWNKYLLDALEVTYENFVLPKKDLHWLSLPPLYLHFRW